MIPPSVDGVEPARVCGHDDVTRRIRNPFLESSSALPEAEAAGESATPVLSLSTLPVDPDETPLPVLATGSREDPDDPALAADPFEAQFSEISRNIHHVPTPLPSTSEDPPAEAPRPQRHGLVVVAAVIVIGVAVDLFLWKTTGDVDAEAAAQPAVAADVAVGPEEPVKPPVPVIAPLPVRSHIEISVQAENASLVLDGKPVHGHRLELDVPADEQPHALEVAAPGFAPFKRTVSFARDLYLAIELQRASSPPVPAAPAPAKRTGRARAEGTDKFAGPFVPTPEKAPPTTIDETDPYAP